MKATFQGLNSMYRRIPRKNLQAFGLALARAALLLAYLFPIVWVFLTSIKPPILTVTPKPVWIFQPTLVSYQALFRKYDFGRFISNSLTIAFWSTLITTALSTTAAYALSRHAIRRRDDIAFWILSTRMLPPIASVLPVFILMRTWGLLDTKLSMIVMYSVFNIPLSVWIIKAFMAQLPKELEEAALVDGCSVLRAFTRIALPLSLPGIVAAATLTFILAWNEFTFALVLAQMKAKTFPVAIAGFQAKHGLFLGELSAGAIVGTLPILVVALLLGRYIVAGLTVGALK
ncbi:MAG: carbohydrate ABC transporter permease [Bacillota bacterium]|nr:carbohydrate ABC transporter permease [Bacillota bacterium]